jgi:large subunit ribosomal protein L24
MAERQKIRLKVGDPVVVTSGAHKGETGTIKSFTKDRLRVVVEGVNKVRRHEKPMQALGRQGGIVEKEAPMAISNVAYRLGDGSATRIGLEVLDNGHKVRVAKKTGEQIS